MKLVAAFTTTQVAFDQGATVTYPAMKVQFKCSVCGAPCVISRGHVHDRETTGQCACTAWYWVNWLKGEVTQK